MTECKCSVTTNIADELEFGTGRLDFYGFWEFPCPHRNSQDELLPDVVRGNVGEVSQIEKD